MSGKNRVSYFYNSKNKILKDDIGSFNYGHDHPMKPKRIQMAHELIVSYGLYKELNVYV
jgi:histone deacetylase 1/2